MKMLKIFALAAMLIPSLAFSALAAPMQGDKMDQGPRVEMTKEQKAKFVTMHKDFEQKTAGMRDQLSAKFLELRAIQNLPGTTHAEVTKLVDEITTLRGKLRAERQAFVASLEKEGLPTFGYGYHRGGEGGHGMRGGHGGGYGSGGCPGMMDGGHGGPRGPKGAAGGGDDCCGGAAN